MGCSWSSSRFFASVQPKKTRTVSEHLYFACWHFYDPEKELGAALAAGLFVQQPAAFVRKMFGA